MLVKRPHTIVIDSHNVVSFEERKMILVPENGENSYELYDPLLVYD